MDYFQGEFCCWKGIISILQANHNSQSIRLRTDGANILYINQQAGLLLLNSVLILNRRRFLSKYGLDDLNHMHHTHGAGDGVPLRAQIVGLLHAVQYLKVPVIACNIVTIVFEMLLGGT